MTYTKIGCETQDHRISYITGRTNWELQTIDMMRREGKYADQIRRYLTSERKGKKNAQMYALNFLNSISKEI